MLANSFFDLPARNLTGPARGQLLKDFSGLIRAAARNNAGRTLTGSLSSLNCVVFEKQGLADQCRDRCGLIRLGDQERRLWPLASQESLGIGGNENHWHLKRIDKIVYRIEARTAVGKLNIGQDQ